jgi:4-hydroxybenzoate polyprenyltransferase
MFKEWTMLFRSQTAPATVILVMIGFLIGGGELFSKFGLLIFVFSILLHCFIFGNNSLMDTCIVPKSGERPYDIQDKMKKHHPLITGKIKLKTAHKVIYTGIVLLSFAAIIISFYGSGDTSLALAFFLVFVVTGFAYNCGLSKVTVWKFIPISLCFTALCTYGYFLMSNKINNLFILILIYIFLTEVFEVGIEGEQKEIETNFEVNLLKYLGTKTSDNKIYMSFSSKIASWCIKLSNLAVGLYILLYIGLNFIALLVFSVFALLAMYFAYKIIHDKEWGRDIKLRFYSFEEISTIFLLLVILVPFMGLLEVVTLMLFGVVYFIILNRINWGTFFIPKV